MDSAVPEPVALAALQQIGDPGSRGFSVVWRGEPLEGFLVQRQGELFAYRNHCPHVGAPLDWSPHQFLDAEGGYIQCAMHGALFEIGSGVCVAGPCGGRSLEPLQIVVHDGQVWLDG